MDEETEKNVDIETADVETLGFTDSIALLNETLANDEYSKLHIKLNELNHPLFANDEFVSLIKDRCIKDRHFTVQIILSNVKPSKPSAEFVRYYQRLTDKIKLKRYIPPQVEPDTRQFIVVDDKLVLWQPNPRFTDFRILRAGYRIKYSERDISLLKLYL